MVASWLASARHLCPAQPRRCRSPLWPPPQDKYWHAKEWLARRGGAHRRAACRAAVSAASSHQPWSASHLWKRATGSRARHARISSAARYLQAWQARLPTGSARCIRDASGGWAGRVRTEGALGGAARWSQRGQGWRMPSGGRWSRPGRPRCSPESQPKAKGLGSRARGPAQSRSRGGACSTHRELSSEVEWWPLR